MFLKNVQGHPWCVGPIVCRTIGVSDQWCVGPMVCRTNGQSPPMAHSRDTFLVKLFTNKAYESSQYFAWKIVQLYCEALYIEILI